MREYKDGMAKKKIIIVDDNPSNLTVCKEILKDLFEAYPVLSAEKMFELLEHVIPDLFLLDVDMPVMDGYEAIKKLKNDKRYRDIPVMFLTAMDDSFSEIEGLSLGAVDYITKPFVSSSLIQRIEQHLVLTEGKKNLTELNNDIRALLADGADPGGQTSEVVAKLLAKSELMTEMVHAMLAPLNTVIERMQTAMKIDRTNTVRHCLSIADTESAMLLQIVNNILESDESAG